ncbi:MFS transporter [Candidatus Spongiisocius sp.]|uniref:MFS transporter n=1 Tax=Candidatus Spongiisocius sp. TaxID=3101273 RepID=UPI003B5A30D7
MTTEGGAGAPGLAPKGFIGTGRAAALFCAVIMVTHGFGNGLVPALLPRIGESFGSGYGALGLAVSSGLLAYGLGAAVGVRVVDVFPLRGIILAALSVCVVGFLVAVWSTSPLVLAGSVVLISLLAPISWSASVRLIARVVEPSSLGRVTVVASSGAGVGGGINGAFAFFLARPDEWRLAFVVATAVSAVTALAILLSLPGTPASRPRLARTTVRQRDWRATWAVRTGRVVILLSVAAGVGAFTFVSYMSATAVDEFGVSPAGVAVLWWIASSVGLTAAVVMGAWSDRVSPVLVIGVISLAYSSGLLVLVLTWSYAGLMVAALGFGFFNYPIWGLLGHLAGQGMEPRLAVRAFSGGLTAAAWCAVSGIALAGWWIERTGSFRIPVIVLAVLSSLVTGWLVTEYARRRVGAVFQHPPSIGVEGPERAAGAGTENAR